MCNISFIEACGYVKPEVHEDPAILKHSLMLLRHGESNSIARFSDFFLNLFTDILNSS